MPELAIITLNRREHSVLSHLWKFFPFESDIQYHYLYPGKEDEDITSLRTNVHSLAFSGKLEEVIEAMDNYLKENNLSHICFSSLETQAVWSRYYKQNAVTIYTSQDLYLADISVLPSACPEKLEAISELVKRDIAVLLSEAGTFLLPENTTIYPDFNSFTRTMSHEILLTKNKDLVSAVCKASVRHYFVLHLINNKVSLNLSLDTESFDFGYVFTNLSLATKWIKEGIDSALQERNKGYLPYSVFAYYYDIYMSHVNYEEWIDGIIMWYKQMNPNPLYKILELACGTANASSLLTARGFEVDACDASPYMLQVADSKPIKPNLYQAYLTDPIPKKDYDLIFCIFDSINYLLHPEEISTVLDNVYEALAPQGVFIFDISTLLNSMVNFYDSTNYLKVHDAYIIQRSNYNTFANHQLTHIIIFRKHLHNYELFEERHTQRVYYTPELIKLCNASKLKLKAIYSPEKNHNLLGKNVEKLDNNFFRLFFVLQKER